MKISQTRVFNLKDTSAWYQWLSIFNVRMAKTPELGNQKLWLKFCDNTSNGVRVMERTRMPKALMDGHMDVRWTLEILEGGT